MMFYKYRSFDEASSSKKWTTLILKDQELFFSGIKGFNDPFDGRVYLNYHGMINEIKAAQVRVQYDSRLVKVEKHETISLKDTVDLIEDRITSDYNQPSFSGELQGRIQKIHDTKGVLSLSENNNNILMWSHYADNHKGLCLGFDWDVDSGLFGTFQKMKYQTHYDDIWAWLHTEKEIVDRILYSKSIDWAYEKEYRIVKDNIGSEKFDNNNLKEIIFGCLMSDKDKTDIVTLTKDIYPNVIYKETVMNVQKYELNLIDYK